MAVPAIRRESNPALFTSVDGVIIDERTPPAGVRGVPGNKAIVIGEFQKGPVDVVTRIGSTQDLINIFGGPGPDAAGAYYKGYLSLLGKRFGQLYVIRVSNSTQVTATLNFDDGDGSPTDVLKVDASSPGVWGNAVQAAVEAASDGSAGKFDLRVIESGITVELHRNLDPSTVANTEQYVITSNFVVLTRLADGVNAGRPANAAATNLASGADGTFADADYVGSPSDKRGIELLYGDAASDIRWVYVAEQSSAAINGALQTLAATEPKNCILSGPAAQDLDAGITDVDNYRGDRIGYTAGRCKAFLPEANALVEIALNSFAASVLAALAPGENPAGVNGENLLTGIKELTLPNLGTADYQAARAAGLMAFQRTKESGKFGIRSGITTSLNSAEKNWARRTIADYIQDSVAIFLTTFRNKRLTADNKKQIEVAVTDFLNQAVRDGILPSERGLNEGRDSSLAPLLPFEVDPYSLNTPESEAEGIFIVLIRARVGATMDFIVLRTEIGERVEVFQQAA